MSTDEDKPNKREADQPKLLTRDAEPLDINEEAANTLGIDPEVLEQLPPEARQIVKEMFLMQLRRTSCATIFQRTPFPAKPAATL